jgi:hypothetical protein
MKALIFLKPLVLNCILFLLLYSRLNVTPVNTTIHKYIHIMWFSCMYSRILKQTLQIRTIIYTYDEFTASWTLSQIAWDNWLFILWAEITKKCQRGFYKFAQKCSWLFVARWENEMTSQGVLAEKTYKKPQIWSFHEKGAIYLVCKTFFVDKSNRRCLARGHKKS